MAFKLGHFIFLSPLLSERLELSKNGEFQCVASVHLTKLTDRQWDVLLRIAEGRRVSEVARDLEISPKAVESHKLHAGIAAKEENGKNSGYPAGVIKPLPAGLSC